MSKSARLPAGVTNDVPKGLFDVLGYKKGKLSAVISPAPMDFVGAVAMAAGYSEKPSPITAVVVPAGNEMLVGKDYKVRSACSVRMSIEACEI